MPYLVDHPTRFRRVRQFHRMADATESHALHGQPLGPVEPDGAPQERHFQFLRGCLRSWFLGHDYAPTSSASSLPRYRATSDGSFRSISPLKVARTTLCGFADPSDLVSTF